MQGKQLYRRIIRALCSTELTGFEMMSMTEMLSMNDSELEKTVLTQKLGQFLDILMSMKFDLN